MFLQTFRKETKETIRRILQSKSRGALRKYEKCRKCGGAEFQREWQNEFENLLQQIADGIEVGAIIH